MSDIYSYQQTPVPIVPQHIPPSVHENVPLHDTVWFQTGGVARWYAEPITSLEFQELVRWAHKYQIPVDVIGEGSNLLVADTGVPGLVLRPRNLDIRSTMISDTEMLVTFGSGVTLHEAIEYSLTQGLLGLEEFSGIPGTIGGAVFINVHYFQYLLSHFLVAATIVNRATGDLAIVDATWFNFGYNMTRLHERTHYLVDATFLLKRVDMHIAAFAGGRRAEIIRHRRQRYPYTRTCGSFFRNFYPEEVTMTSNGKKLIYIAYYLDKLGVKGTLSWGNALISHQHANMIVTQPGATSDDVIQLARTMQQMVHDTFGIMPQPECQFLGFPVYPLLR